MVVTISMESMMARGQVALGVPGFLAGGGGGVEADVGEEDPGGCGARRRRRPCGMRGSKCAAVEGGEGHGAEEQQDADLDQDDRRVDPGAFLGAADQQDHGQERQ